MKSFLSMILQNILHTIINVILGKSQLFFFVRVGGCYPYWYMYLFHPVWYSFVPKGGRGGLQTLKFPILVKK